MNFKFFKTPNNYTYYDSCYKSNVPKIKYDRQKNLYAKNQFLIKKLHTTTPTPSIEDIANVDLLVPWENVQQVAVKVYEELICPICLYPPVAGKITKCGHIYCWHCILHFLALTNTSWGNCPVCYDMICKNDLKSVVSQQVYFYKENDEILFCLMKREQKSMKVIKTSITIDEQNNCADPFDTNIQLKYLEIGNNQVNIS